jgi:hypothetical protein
MSDQDSNLDLGGYGAIPSSYGTDTITIDPSIYSAIGSLTLPTTVTTGNTYTISGTGGGAGTGINWTTGSSYYPTTNTSVQINADGMQIKEGGDIKIGGKSLSDAIDKIEERLGILNPNPELEDRWNQLKELRKQYIELEKDLLEKEKMWKILKET